MKQTFQCRGRLFLALLGGFAVGLAGEPEVSFAGEPEVSLAGESGVGSDEGLSMADEPEDAFTIVIIPDTQHYVGPGTKMSETGKSHVQDYEASDYTRDHAAWQRQHDADAGVVANPYLQRHVEWILRNRDALRIKFVSHVGDIVERNRPAEWRVASRHLDRLRGVVPFGLTVGNHDMENDGDASLFQSTFPASSFEPHQWYLASYQHDRSDRSVSRNNVNSVQKFRAGGIDFLFLHLECNAPDDVLKWANQTIAAHPHHRVLITTHMDLGVLERPKTSRGYIEDPKGRMRWSKIHGSRGNSGVDMWEKCYRLHPNLDFVFSGDQSRVTALRISRPADDGHIVHALLSDYQSLGAIRVLKFHPTASSVEVITYDTALKRRVTQTPYAPDIDQHHFTVTWPR